MIKAYLCRFEETDRHNIAARLAEYALQDTFSVRSSLSHDSRGKPLYTTARDRFISISHSHEMCLAVLSDSEVGADIEYMKKKDINRLLKISKRYFTADEQQYVEKDPETRFYEVWCSKESYMKYTGEGFAKPMPSFSVFSGDFQYLRQIYENYMIAVCTTEEAFLSPILVDTDIIGF